MSTGNFVISDCPFEESESHLRGEIGRCPPGHVAVARQAIRPACVHPPKSWTVFHIVRRTVAAVTCALVFLVAMAACTGVIAAVGYLNIQVIRRMRSAYDYRAQADSYSEKLGLRRLR